MTIAGPVADAAVAFTAPELLDEVLEVGGRNDVSGRSARNIAAWKSYLPADCVAAMIAMGWDEST